MQQYVTSLPYEPYPKNISVINDIRFTARELDLLACLLSRKGAKIIGSVLSITARTVEAHTHNIMLKLECNSRDNIVNFLEQSENLAFFRERYLQLKQQAEFERALEKASQQTGDKSANNKCLIIYCTDAPHSLPFIQHLKKHLSLAGVEVSIHPQQKLSSLQELPQALNEHDPAYILWVASSSSSEENADHKTYVTLTLTNPQTSSLLFEKLQPAFEDKDNPKDYYEVASELLAKILPHFSKVDLPPLRAMEQNLSLKQKPLESSPTRNASNVTLKTFLLRELHANLKQKLFIAAAGISILLALVLSSQYYLPNDTSFQTLVSPSAPTIRSNLFVPNAKILLRRSQLIREIDEKLKGSEAIQSIALVGIGGAGKTTLVRAYALSQKAISVIWEINAETKQSLLSSFENLAYALASTAEEKQETDHIHKIKDGQEHERKLLSVVRERLRRNGQWLLLFDNVDNLLSIKDFFPYDSEAWGSGKVIITTQDTNVKNNPYINPEKVITVNELDEKEKILLFKNILQEANTSSSDAHDQQVASFLKTISPFPLDVSTAAYYIKDTNISYQEYAQRIRAVKADFEHAQLELIKEISDYTKTRYGIITLTIDKLIEKNQDFKEPLLMMSLLDSQDIPRDLLEQYKPSSVVIQFLRELRKHSFIINETAPEVSFSPLFSLHRSTQDITLKYIVSKLTKQDYHKNLRTIINLVTAYSDPYSKKYNYHKAKLFIRHIESLLVRVRSLEKEGAEEEIVPTIDLLKNLGILYRQLGDYRKAQELEYKGYQAAKKHYGDHHVKTAQLLVHVGISHNFLGEYSQAENCFQQALPIYKKSYGNEHRETAWLQVNYGNNCRDLGKFKEAETLYQHSLVTFKKSNEIDSNLLACALVNLGKLHQSFEDHNTAKMYLEQALELFQKQYGADHPKLGWVFLHLGNTYQHLGDYQRSEKLLTQSLGLYQKHYGPTHIKTAGVFLKLGKFYMKIGKYKDAQTALEKSFAVYHQHYGDQHIRLAEIPLDLGRVYLLTDQLEQAEKRINESLKIYSHHHHSEIFMVFEILGDLYYKKSQAAYITNPKTASQLKTQSLNYLNQALKIVLNTLSEDSTPTYRIKEKIKEYSNPSSSDSKGKV